MNIILASNSPRRTEILTLAKIPHKVIPSKVKEVVKEGLTPYEIVVDLSYQKASDVFKDHPNDLVIGSDTIVVIDNIVLGKPKDFDDAVRMLQMLSGRTHEVITGVTLIHKEEIIKFYEVSLLTFYEMSLEEIKEYISTDNVYDKAGSYAIQESCCKHIKKIDGDYYNIMGLPISKIYQVMKEKKLLSNQ